MPSVDSDVVVTTRMSPGRHSSIAAWIIRLSPAWHEIVTALPAAFAVGIDRAHVRAQQARPPLRLVHRGDAVLAERVDDVGVGALDRFGRSSVSSPPPDVTGLEPL